MTNEEEVSKQIQETIALIPNRARYCVNKAIIEGAAKGNVSLPGVSVEAIRTVASCITPTLKLRVVAYAVLFAIRFRKAIDEAGVYDSDSESDTDDDSSVDSNSDSDADSSKTSLAAFDQRPKIKEYGVKHNYWLLGNLGRAAELREIAEQTREAYGRENELRKEVRKNAANWHREERRSKEQLGE